MRSSRSYRSNSTVSRLGHRARLLSRGPARILLAMFGLLALALLSAPAPACADSYVWHGRIGRLEVDVHLLGFREGAGAGGWSEDGARRFARRGAELEAMLRARVHLVESVEDDRGLLAIVDGQTIETGLRDFDGADADWDALVAFFRARGYAPRAARPIRVLTIELAASTPADADVAEPPDQMYAEACAPCSIPSVHALGARRVVGLFATRAEARRALAWLRARGIAGRIAPL